MNRCNGGGGHRGPKGYRGKGYDDHRRDDHNRDRHYYSSGHHHPRYNNNNNNNDEHRGGGHTANNDQHRRDDGGNSYVSSTTTKNVQKRPASVSGEDGKRIKLEEDTAQDQSIVDESPPNISSNDDHEVVLPLPEEEEANRIAFKNCLREMDKDLPVCKMAYQNPRERWNEEEHKFETWIEKERNAARATIASISKDLESGIITKPNQSLSNHYECDSDSSDDYPPGVSHNSTPQRDLSLMEMRFINALPYCLPLNRGFHVDDSFGSEICYCPCAINVGPWRMKHEINFDDDQICKHKERFELNALMAHLYAESNILDEKGQLVTTKSLRCIYHYAAAMYLRLLYTDWHGEGFSHKALFPLQSSGWKRADAEEKRQLRRAVEIGNAVIKKQQAELEKKDQEMASLREVAKDHLEQLEELEKMKEKLGVEKKLTKIKLSDKQIDKYNVMMTNYFDTMKRVKGTVSDGIEIVVTSTATDDRGFNLQSFFDNLYTSKEKGDSRTVLFDDDNSKNNISRLILSEWSIVYDKHGLTKTQKDEDTAIDKGGPSRQFLTDVFKQIGSLSILVESTSSARKVDTVALFEDTSSGVMVTTDEKLNSDIEATETVIELLKKNAVKQANRVKKNAIEQAKRYIRAIGRIMLHALANRQTLPTNALPPFFINLMFRGYDEDYEHDDVLNHIGMLGFSGKILNYYLIESGDWTRETFFAKFIPETVINSRTILLGGLQDGLTVGGKEARPSDEIENGCGFASALNIPFDAIQYRFFAKPDICVEDLINVIVPQYMVGEPLRMTTAELEDIREKQKIFFNGNFKQYLRESAEEIDDFLVKFVECATGSNYIPFDQTFKINLEFDFSICVLGNPMFHSCTHDIRISGYPYFFEDYKTFKDVKMNQNILMVYNRFDMH